jgi:2-amino-4-hydroxy-6-hydroxymethyldihydropteridine diphosphokinase
LSKSSSFDRMEIVYLSLGSNQGNRIKYLQNSVSLLESTVGEVLTRSSYFETEPWGFNTDTFFINQVIGIKTFDLPAQLLEKILKIERQLGRVRMQSTQIYTNRCIDIDILFYGGKILKESDLIIPHKFLHERRFVLEPLNQIAGNFVHPAFNKSIHYLLLECKDKTKVKLYEVKEFSLLEI